MNSLSTVTFTGKSGTPYSFYVFPIGQECKDQSGVYIFSKREKIGDKYNHTAIYIGMAKSFETRFYNHHKGDCIDKNGANSLCLMEIKDESKRTSIEKDLLVAYPTKCNEVLNPVTPK